MGHDDLNKLCKWLKLKLVIVVVFKR